MFAYSRIRSEGSNVVMGTASKTARCAQICYQCLAVLDFLTIVFINSCCSTLNVLCFYKQNINPRFLKGINKSLKSIDTL